MKCKKKKKIKKSGIQKIKRKNEFQKRRNAEKMKNQEIKEII